MQVVLWIQGRQGKYQCSCIISTIKIIQIPILLYRLILISIPLYHVYDNNNPNQLINFISGIDELLVSLHYISTTYLTDFYNLLYGFLPLTLQISTIYFTDFYHLLYRFLPFILYRYLQLTLILHYILVIRINSSEYTKLRKVH